MRTPEGREAAWAAIEDALGGAAPRAREADSAIRAELSGYLGERMWCADGGFGVERDGPDMWRRFPKDRWYTLAADFLGHRAAWAEARAEGAAEYGEAALKAARAVAEAWAADDRVWRARQLADDAASRRTVAMADLDADPGLIGTPAGVVELATGLPARERDEAAAELGEGGAPWAEGSLTTLRAGASLPGSRDGWGGDDLPRWASFVSEVCSGDAEKASFLKRALGYSLYGANPEKAVFVLLGTTRDNGKSTLMAAVRAAMGDYAATAPPSFLAADGRAADDSKPDPVLASLAHARLVDVGEMDAGARLDEAKLKRLSSGTDPVSCRFLHKDQFSYVPGFTLWLHMNSLPAVRDASALAEGRMHVVTFDRHFAPAERDLGLAAELTSPRGRETVLRWMVEGYSEYLVRGLDPPACVRDATAEWAEGTGDLLERFVRSRCELGPGKSCDVRDFQAALADYAAASGAEQWEVPSARATNRRLQALHVYRKPSNGRYLYRGLELRGGWDAAGDRAGARRAARQETAGGAGSFRGRGTEATLPTEQVGWSGGIRLA